MPVQRTDRRAVTAAAERLFFAVRPDAATAQRIEALAQAVRSRHGLRGRSLGPERFHVTLHLVGDFADGIPASVRDASLRAAEPVARLAAPFVVGLDSIASFTRKRRNMPVVLLGGEDGVRGVAQLQQALWGALVAAGLASRPEPRFTPHLTLLYDDVLVEPARIDPVIWPVNEMLLVRSLLGKGRHEVLARLPLQGAAA